MRYSLGRLMQFVALIILPTSIVFEATGMLGRKNFGVADMLVMMGVGVVLFAAGWFIQGPPPKM